MGTILLLLLFDLCSKLILYLSRWLELPFAQLRLKRESYFCIVNHLLSISTQQLSSWTVSHFHLFSIPANKVIRQPQLESWWGGYREGPFHFIFGTHHSDKVSTSKSCATSVTSRLRLSYASTNLQISTEHVRDALKCPTRIFSSNKVRSLNIWKVPIIFNW